MQYTNTDTAQTLTLPDYSPAVDPDGWACALRCAAKQRTPIPPLRLRDAKFDIAGAYAIQEINTRHGLEQGRRLAGRKIGLTSVPVQKQLGVSEPDYGMLFADMQVLDAGVTPERTLIQPRIEGEIAFVLRSELSDPACGTNELISAIAYAVPALEIVDSRIEKWNIGITDTVADNASSGLFVLGRRHTLLADFDPVGCRMRLFADDRIVSEGQGSLTMGSPLVSALWLARKMASIGRPLRAGDVILTGALGPMVPLEGGVQYRIEIEGLGSAQVTAG